MRRTADTQLMLATGGPLGSTQKNLWVISASAMDVATGQPIPYDQISIGGFGKLGTDGNLYLVLPDNDPATVTPIVPGNNDYTRTVNGQEDPLKVAANGVVLDPSVVVTDAHFCVGQDVPLALIGLPDGVTATNFQWTLAGTYVNECIPAPNTNSSAIYTNEPALLKNAVITNCWWVSGASNPPTYQASVTYTLLFTNGNPPHTSDTSGRFTMHRPQLYAYTNFSPTIGANIWTNQSDHVVYLITTNPGAYFKTYLHSAFGGQAGVTQLANGYMTNTAGGRVTGGTYALDTQEFYPSDYTDSNGLIPVIAGAQGAFDHNIAVLGDVPGINCHGHTEMHLAFADYIRFQPNQSGSIFVTLGKVNWHIYATANSATNGYVLGGPPDGAIDPSYTDSQEFPRWTNILHNIP